MKISLVTKDEKIILIADNYILKNGEKGELGSILHIVNYNMDVELEKEYKDKNNKYIVDEIIKPGEILVINETEEEFVRLR